MAHAPSKRSFSEVSALPSYHELLPSIAQVLTALCVEGDKKFVPKKRSLFECTEPAPTSCHDYLVRLCKYGHCTKWVFIVMAIYLNRYRHKTGAPLNSYTMHRLMLTSFVVAAKVRDDVYYANKYYATVGGVSVRDLNAMEATFLTVMDWDLHVDGDEFEASIGALSRGAPHRSREDAGRSEAAAARGCTPPASPPPEHRPQRTSYAKRAAGVAASEQAPDVDDHGAGRSQRP
eukprot:TRINITY_DN2273_c3_g1_i2.p1 TRINITY_DN2273_c3_g1~~TRINITY_DN2273_c3_g1_i2.p1  ORF type:complete len:233 (+),score=29.57 TRINITY_DN2273_c3_g1_i2:184-882(+)